MKASAKSWLARIAISLLGLALLITILYMQFDGASTTTVTASSDGKTTTTTQNNILALAVATGLIALLSAVITTTLGHWYTNTTERNKRTAEVRREHARRVREQVAAVASDIAAMLEEVRPTSEQLMSAGYLDGAELSEHAMFAVRKSYYKAMPHIEVLDDEALRLAANDIFGLRESWYAENREALLNQTQQPDTSKADEATEKFFERARHVIADAEADQQ